MRGDLAEHADHGILSLVIVTLSNGQKVHLKEVWTHKFQKVFQSKLFENETATVVSIYNAYEALFPEVIDRIDAKDSSAIPYSLGWLETLPEKDYKELVKAVDDIGELKGAEGKKKE